MSSKFLFPRSSSQPQMSLDQFLTVPIGKGSYGTVFRGIHKRTFQKYAIKEIFKKGHQRFIHYELQIMYSIDCSNIVRLHDHFQTQTSAYLLMEYVEGRQLFDGIINKKIKLNYREVAKIIYELCSALQYIHNLKIIHRDVKPQNILLTKQGKLKLADFGAANYLLENQDRKTFIGTPQYMAPELLYENEQSSAVDIWAVGVILFELTTMKLPFTAKTTPKIYENIKNIRYEFPVSIERDHELKQLIKSILVADPMERPSARKIVNHQWIQKYLRNEIANSIELIQPISIKQQKDTVQIQTPIQKNQNNIQSKQILQQVQPQVKQKQKSKDSSQQSYRQQLSKKITELQTKIGVSRKLKDKKQMIIQANKLHIRQLQAEIDSHFQFKEQLESIQNDIKNGDTRYFAALQERTKLKAYEFKLKQEINKYKVLQRKGSMTDKKSYKGKDIATTSTISSNRMNTQQRERNQSNTKLSTPLQKSLSFSILQIQTLLSQIREKKQRISGTASSTNLIS